MEEMPSLAAPPRNVAIFCASANGAKPVYAEAAAALASALARRRVGIVYGGASVGLMHVVAQAALAEGGSVIGVIPSVLADAEIAHRELTELHITDSMHTRKAMMSERSEAFIALPGGFGTFEELFEVLAWQTLRLHAKPVFLLNIHGFYDGLLAFLNHCVEEGMLKEQNRNILNVADSVEELLGSLGLT